MRYPKSAKNRRSHQPRAYAQYTKYNRQWLYIRMKKIWEYINEILFEFRPCFSKERSFLWFVVAVVGFMLRSDHLGVTSVIRELGINSDQQYECLLHFFRSKAWKLEDLIKKWAELVIGSKWIYRGFGRPVLIGDGVNESKEGKHMPSVKKLHQESENSGKPEYIWGHMFGGIGVLIGNAAKLFCLPISMSYYENENEVRNMQNFMQNGAWDHERMLAVYQKQLSGYIAGPDGMITVDSSGFPKKGNESVGVARQYCGRLGKTDNCQDGVFVGYTSSTGYGLLRGNLYMPKKWFEADYAERREKCGVPEDLKFKTKPQIALESIREIMAAGEFPARWIGVDAGFGSDHDFLSSLPEGLLYFADIHKNTTFFTSMPDVAIPPYKGKGKIPTLPKPSFSPVSAESIAIDSKLGLKWDRTYLGEGAKGPIYSDTACLRVIECLDGLPGAEIWLYFRRLSDGTLKYTISNAPSDTPKPVLDEQTLRRWPIEQCFEECKSQLGMDHCEARSWNSWHRHMILVFIAFLFIMTLRFQFKKQQPLLTLPQVKCLVAAVIDNILEPAKMALKLVRYYVRRNYTAYLSHKKHTLSLLGFT